MARLGRLLGGVLAVALLAVAPVRAQEAPVRTLDRAGLTLVHPPELTRLAQALWQTAEADRATVSTRLGIRPDAALLILFGTRTGPQGEVYPPLPPNSAGAYFLGTGVLVLAPPGPAAPDLASLRGVLRHELIHALLDAELRAPIPRWLNEGLAVLLSGELQFLDETVLTLAAATGNLIPLRHLAYGFPAEHRQRSLAYAQAASFARYLLAQEGMPGLRRLVQGLDGPAGLDAAFVAAYGRDLPGLEADWAGGLATRFSILGLVALLGSGSLLGIIATPLLLIAWWRKRKEQRAALAQLAAQDAAQAEDLGPEPDGPGAESPPREAPTPGRRHRHRSALRSAVGRWRPPRPPRPPED